jgi:hypothetical protein
VTSVVFFTKNSVYKVSECVCILSHFNLISGGLYFYLFQFVSLLIQIIRTTINVFDRGEYSLCSLAGSS